jgi:tight adherence protein C
MAPDFYLGNRAGGRGKQILDTLPDALDLLTISVEAGLGFDAALIKVTEKLKGALSEEFKRAAGEQRVGKARQEALRGITDRVEQKELTNFISAIIQADQLGIALSRILRVQSHDMRVRRQLAAEEKAMKAPVKMLFPTVIFVFPSMFVVALGPAALNLLQTFSGGGIK